MSRDSKVPLDDDAMALLAGEITAALLAEPPVPNRTPDAMPAGLADRLIASGEHAVRADAVAQRRAAVQAAATAPHEREARRAWLWSGWLSAAAVLAMWAVGAGRVPPRVETTTPGTQKQAVRALRDSLIVQDVAVTKLDWSATQDSASVGASGDVVWSASRQAGVMRFAGLKPNDRKRWQYQLWIFDKRRDQRYPVDGGVFDIPSGTGDVMVPIRARVPVGEAVLFAVTVEAPGGVVVSTRERIALLAKTGG